MEVPLKTKNRITIWSRNPTPRHISRKDGNSNSKGYMLSNIYSKSIYNIQLKCPSIYVYICCFLLFSHWVVSDSFAIPWTVAPPDSSVHGISQARILVHAKSLQSCPTLCDPMDCSPPGFSVHGILQARILKWVAISFARVSSQPRDQIHRASALTGRSLTTESPESQWNIIQP